MYRVCPPLVCRKLFPMGLRSFKIIQRYLIVWLLFYDAKNVVYSVGSYIM